MANIRQLAERLMFGATAEEAVAARIALIDRRVELALDRLADALAADEEARTEEETPARAEGTS